MPPLASRPSRLLTVLRTITPCLLKIKGGRRIVELAERCSVNSGDLLISNFLGNNHFWCQMNEHMSSHIFWRGVYSTEVVRYLARYARCDDVFLDVGANHGELTIAAAALMPKGAVFALEPVSENFVRLNRNVYANRFSHVTPLQLGLANEAGFLPIYTHQSKRSDGTLNKGLPSLYASSERDSLVESVTLQRLDDFVAERGITRLDWIKLDVEGAELSALQGGLSTLKRLRPKLLVEFNADTCESAGYTVQHLALFIMGQRYSLYALNENGTVKTNKDGTSALLQVSDLPRFCNVLACPV